MSNTLQSIGVTLVLSALGAGIGLLLSDVLKITIGIEYAVVWGVLTVGFALLSVGANE